MYRVSTLNQHIFIISFYHSLFDPQVAVVGEELVVTHTGEEVEQHSGEEEVEVVEIKGGSWVGPKVAPLQS